MKTKNSKLDKAFYEILDCFSGADGGGAFIDLQNLIECLEKQSRHGDESAEKILKVVFQFSRLIEIAKKNK